MSQKTKKKSKTNIRIKIVYNAYSTQSASYEASWGMALRTFVATRKGKGSSRSKTKASKLAIKNAKRAAFKAARKKAHAWYRKLEREYLKENTRGNVIKSFIFHK